MKNNPIEKIPLGLSMALSNNPVAFTRFANMTPKQQEEIIEATHLINSKKEMREFVNRIENHRFS